MGNSATFTTPANSSAAGTGVTNLHPVSNNIDEIGLLLGTERIVGERNAEYKQRLISVFAERANSTYLGLIHGITRGLGLSIYNALSLVPTGGVNPGLIISGAYVYIYSDITNKTLDRKIDRFNPTGNARNLTSLVNRINESSCFTATLTAQADPYSRSMVLLNQDSSTKVVRELVSSNNKIKLLHQNIVKGSLFLSDKTVFATEVASANLVTKVGSYFVDYTNGLVLCYQPSLDNTVVRYSYRQNPYLVKASPVILYDTHSPDFKVKLFEQILQDDGTFINGLPTALGSDIINELLTVHPTYWGE